MSNREIDQRINRIISSYGDSITKCHYCSKKANDGDGDENVCSYSRCVQCDDEIRLPKCKNKFLICENCPIR
jgi:hypothetical protein